MISQSLSIMDDPLTDRDYHFIQQYGLHCWKDAIRLDGVNHESNGDKSTQTKCESQYRTMKTFYRPTGDDSVYRDIELTEFVGTEDEVRQAYRKVIILEVIR